MESGCLSGVVCKLLCLKTDELTDLLLTAQSRHYELTKSLVNLLWNIVRSQSVRPNKTTRQAIERNEAIVWQLLSDRPSLATKTRLLVDHLDLVYALSRSCPKLPRPAADESSSSE